MTVTSESKKQRRNRTPEEVIADLEAKIANVKARAETKKAKAKPEAKALIQAVKAVDKALEAARAEKNEGLAKDLASVQATLGATLVEQGIRLPARGKRKGQAA